MILALFALALSATAPNASQAVVSWGTEPIRMSDTGPSNLLPAFFFMAGGEEGGSYTPTTGYDGGLGTPSPFYPPDTCPDDVFEATSKDLRVPVVPYLEQDDWGCQAKGATQPEQVKVIVVETDTLRAAVTPQWSGKVWSLYHKKLKRQMFFNNPAHQPANIGYRKAWVSGGAEWNWAPGYIGHSVFTEDTVYSATIPSARGDILRVWDYDRLNNTVWQVDMLLEGDVLWCVRSLLTVVLSRSSTYSPLVLYVFPHSLLYLLSCRAHPKITNPNEADIDGYWWTCVAMPSTPKTRVVSPATASITPCAPWPYGSWTNDNASYVGADIGGCAATQTCAWQQDMSFLGNIPRPHDFFFRIDKTRLPHVTHVAEDGFAVIHSHPAWMNGTKFFTWGAHDQGTFNQDFLSGSDYTNAKCAANQSVAAHYDAWCSHYEHQGLYTELQVGPAASQLHTFPINGSRAGEPVSEYQWTEWFKAWQADPAQMQHPDYRVPVAAVDAFVASAGGMPQAEIEGTDAFLERMSSVPPLPEHVLTTGSPWGALREEADGGTHLARGCRFNLTVSPETRPWIELLRTGTFSAATLALTPVSFQTDDGWMARLEAGLAAGHETWLHYLHLGTCHLERGEVAPARAALAKSMQLQPSVHAARNLATAAPDADSALAYYKTAWATWKQLHHLGAGADPAAARLGKDLGRELTAWLLATEQWDELRPFVAELPDVAGLRGKDQVLHARAALAVHDGELRGSLSGAYAEAIDILSSHCFPTYGIDRRLLLNLWLRAQAQRESAELYGGRNLTRRELVRLKRKINCDGTSSTMVTPSGDPKTQQCLNGPPNLGYPYG